MRAKYLSLVLFFCALFLAPAAHADAVVGQAVPAFTTPTLDGKNFDLAALKGKVVVLHFWATWCAACREEMPALEAVYRQYHNKGLEVLAVSADRPRAQSDVDQVMHYFTFPASMLGAVTKNELGTVTAIPVTYVIDKEGTLENILTPDIMPLTQAAFGDEVKSLMDAKPEKKPEAKPDVKPDEK